MVPIADRNVTIDIFARDRASSTFNKVGTAASKNSGHVSSFGRTFGKVGVGIFKAAGVASLALGGLVVAGATMGVKTAASLQQADIAFTTLLHSGQKSKVFLSDLKKFSAATPFELPGLIDASRQLLGAGAAAKSVIPTLTNFGDAAGALGLSQDRFNHVMLATTQAMASGKLQAGDLLQMTEAGLPVWKLLSEATGKPIPKLRELSAQGKLLTKDMLPKLEAQMNKDYGGAMAKQSQTLSGLWSTFTDTLGQGLAGAIMPLLPVMQKLLPGAMAAMGRGLTWVSSHIAGLVKGFQHGSGAGGKLSEIFHAVAGAVKATIPVIKGIAQWIGGTLVPIIVMIARGVGPQLVATWNRISGAIKSHMGIFTQIGQILRTIAIIAIPLVKVGLKILGVAFQVVVTLIDKLVLPAIRGIIRVFLGMVGAIIHGAANAFGWIPGIGPKLREAANKFDQFKARVNNSLNGIHDRHVVVGVSYTVNGKPGRYSGKGLPAMAGGGPVMAGRAYTVGERGSETFVPSVNGYIRPHGGSGGGSSTVRLHPDDLRALARMLAGAVQAPAGRGDLLARGG